ncbi:MAG: deoxyribonuclease IV [Thermodesulfovibrionales bacterium]
MPTQKRRLGVHTSIAGGVHFSMERAKVLGCNTVQIFSHNPRTWSVSPIPEDAILLFKELRKAYDIDPVFIHSSYLINLASPSSNIRGKSANLLIQEMDLADVLDADYVVLHTGSASQVAEAAARKTAIATLREVSKKRYRKASILLENTAGERGDITSRMTDLAEIIDEVESPLISGVTIDTCHAFQAGYELTSRKGLTGMIKEIEASMGLERIKLIHLNDSKKSFHSRVDRHEHIGSGSIGKRGLQTLINHPSLMNIPLILETPKKGADDDLKNLAVVKKLIKP